MASLITYKGLQIVTPAPTGDAGEALNENFIAIADELASLGEIGGLSGYSGYSSSSGYSGYSSNSGFSAYSGPSGFSGYSGPSGFSGYSGSGFSGYSGSGFSGYSGIATSGFSGYSSNSGFSGYSGPSGFSGYSSTSGFSGYSGSGFSGYSGSGFSGYSGIGTSGFSGYSGNSGFSAYSGAQGPQGPGGGDSGFSGYSGPSGYSSYSGFSGYSGRSGYSAYSGISGFSAYSGKSGFSGYSGNGSYASVTQYGAVGDGVTDDSSAIQSALDALSSDGTLLFPAATYIIKSPLYIHDDKNFRLLGETGAILQYTPTTGRCLRVSTAGDPNNENTCSIENLIFYGHKRDTQQDFVPQQVEIIADAYVLVRSGSTATCWTSGGHGLSTSDRVSISGATQQEYNGSFVITVTAYNAFTFTVSGTPTTPATAGISIDTINRSGSIATVTTLTNHNFVTGTTVQIEGASVNGYNMTTTITVTGATTFTYTVSGTPANATGGTAFAAGSRYIRVCKSSSLSPSSVTSNGSGTATVNFASAHNLLTGTEITVAGATQTEYNITARITVTSSTQFTYSISGTPATPATGTPVVYTYHDATGLHIANVNRGTLKNIIINGFSNAGLYMDTCYRFYNYGVWSRFNGCGIKCNSLNAVCFYGAEMMYCHYGGENIKQLSGGIVEGCFYSGLRYTQIGQRFSLHDVYFEQNNLADLVDGEADIWCNSIESTWTPTKPLGGSYTGGDTNRSVGLTISGECWFAGAYDSDERDATTYRIAGPMSLGCYGANRFFNGSDGVAFHLHPFSSIIDCFSGNPMSSVTMGSGQTFDENLTGYRRMPQKKSASATLNFGSIAAGATAELTVTVIGASTTGTIGADTAVASPTTTIESGLIWSAYVSAQDTVTVRLANVTGSPIDPASRVWVVDAWTLDTYIT